MAPMLHCKYGPLFPGCHKAAAFAHGPGLRQGRHGTASAAWNVGCTHAAALAQQQLEMKIHRTLVRVMYPALQLMTNKLSDPPAAVRFLMHTLKACKPHACWRAL